MCPCAPVARELVPWRERPIAMDREPTGKEEMLEMLREERQYTWRL